MPRSKFLLLPLVLLLLTTFRAAAQILTPTTLSTALSKPTAKVGEEVELIVNARIDNTWHLYATNFDPDLGPTVFTFTFAKSPAYELVGKPQSIGTKKKFDEVFKGDVTYFERTGQIRQRIRLLQPGALTVKAETEFQTCTDVDGRCIPGEESLSFGPIEVTGTAAPTPAATSKGATGAVVAPPAAVATTTTPDTAGTAVSPAQTTTASATVTAPTPAPEAWPLLRLRRQ
ncbi:protein-disulfide reductase DsbD domain-containing protein [Hymenobacter sp. 5516J-16]|uniref:protein-disulfide reductase DsbD domain-containing protein n=1 Tax=Hymenobacter sp. 5516J-16 TaxID=2932253 RepID=UPI00293F62E7|nr:protein-disulfide reductase DsbD domain-containing protein [Hymenobacter sp. 5516J-16]